MMIRDFEAYLKRELASPNLGKPNPDTAELVLPAAPIVLTNASFGLGIHDFTNKWDHVWNITTAIYLPNGTRRPNIGVEGGCNNVGTGTYLGSYIPPIAGLYTILWNVTYISSTAPDSKQPNCGPPPYTSEFWLLNRTLTVQDTVNGQTATPRPTSTSPGSAGTGNPFALSEGLTTITTKLPTEPTGTGGTHNGGTRLLSTWSSLVVTFFGAVILGPATW